MKKLMIILILGFYACSGSADNKSGENKEMEHDHEGETSVEVKPSNTKWKADAPTKANVANLVEILNKSASAGDTNKVVLAENMQAGLDKLINECKMAGADHDALHVWLEEVIDEVKDLKKDDDPYKEALADLQNEVNSFYEDFE